MKKIIAILLLISCSFTGYSQQVRQTPEGNYVAVKDSAARKTAAVATGKTYTDKDGNVYPVMISKNGKLFVIRTSKNTGRNYNQYLKTE